MKYLTLLVIFSLLSNLAKADCDWSKIKKNSDNTYTYSEELHLCVGSLVQDNKVKTQKIADLTKAISLKDLAIQASDTRANLWMDTSSKLEDRLQKVDSLSSKNSILYFGMGVATTFLAAWAAARLVR